MVEEGVFGDVSIAVDKHNMYRVLISRSQLKDNNGNHDSQRETSVDQQTSNGDQENTNEQKENEPENKGTNEDNYDELVSKSHEGTKVVLQLNGITNPVCMTDLIEQVMHRSFNPHQTR